MNYRIIESWDPIELKEQFSLDVLNNKFDRIFFCCLNEWEWPNCTEQLFGLPLEQVNTLLKEQNNILEVISSGRITYQIPEYSNIKQTSTNVWYAITGLYTLKNVDLSQYVVDRKNLQYHFVSMNYRGRDHRCLLMDLLAKENLIEKGAITWHHTNTDYHSEYDWKYFSPKMMQLTDNFVKHQGMPPTWERLPTEYFQSFCQLVSESTPDSTFMSEKTYTPLFFKIPFIVQSAPGFYSDMDEMGFLRYDELFDYSFDNEVDDYKRTEMIIANVKNIANKSMDELEQLLVTLKPKIEHNFDVACKLATETHNYIEPFKDVLEYCDQLVEIPTHMYFPYKYIKNA